MNINWVKTLEDVGNQQRSSLDRVDDIFIVQRMVSSQASLVSIFINQIISTQLYANHHVPLVNNWLLWQWHIGLHDDHLKTMQYRFTERYLPCVCLSHATTNRVSLLNKQILNLKSIECVSDIFDMTVCGHYGMILKKIFHTTKENHHLSLFMSNSLKKDNV